MYKHLWVWRNVIVKIIYFQSKEKIFLASTKKSFYSIYEVFRMEKKNRRLRKKIRWLNSFDFKMLNVTMIRIQWNTLFFRKNFIFMVYIRTHPEELLFVKNLYQYESFSSYISMIEYMMKGNVFWNEIFSTFFQELIPKNSSWGNFW